jgi:hypothetical protein
MAMSTLFIVIGAEFHYLHLNSSVLTILMGAATGNEQKSYE